MEAIAISGTVREGRGKGPARRLRVAGQVPAIVYGHGVSEPIPVSVDPHRLEKLMQNPRGTNALVDLEVEGRGTFKVLMREIHRHPVKRSLVHLDFVCPDPTRPITFDVPVEVVGRSVGIQTGGKLRKPYREVRLSALPADVPAAVTIDITPLDHGDAIMASQMPLPEGVTPVYDRDYVVVKIVAPKGRKDEPAAAPSKKK